MKRAELLSLVELDPPRFNLLRQRGHLPFVGSAESERGWQEFSLQDAFKLRMMRDLMEGQGLGPAAAGSILRPDVFGIEHAASVSPDLWFGEISKDGGFFTTFRGTLSDLTDAFGDRRDVRAIFVVNASRAARDVLARAGEMGIYA